MNGDPSYLIPILEKMSFDAVNVGNHELYRDSVVDYMTRTAGLVEFLGDRYLTSNVVHAGTKTHIGTSAISFVTKEIGLIYVVSGFPLNILKGKNSNVMVFGFLYNMVGASELVTVQAVESVMSESWFANAVKDTSAYDSILVLAHMHVDDDLCGVILQRIRVRLGRLIEFDSLTLRYLQKLSSSDMPVYFVTGHSHMRAYRTFDAFSSSFEAGRYLDTVGFLSYQYRKHINTPVLATSPLALNNTREEESESALVNHVFIDANVPALEHALSIQETTLRTSDGEDLSKFIKRIQIELGLEHVIGWACETYKLNTTLSAPGSLWGLFQRDVVPSRFPEDHMVVVGNGAWRADVLPKGEIRYDDAIAISPFNNSLFLYESIPADVLHTLYKTLTENSTERNDLPGVPLFVMAPANPRQQRDSYHLVVDSFESETIERVLEEVWETDPPRPTIMVETTTSIWLDYFSENHVDYCKAKGKPPPSKYVSTSVFKTNATEDTLNTLFAVVAMIVVIALGTVYVRQRSMIFEQWSEARQFATIEALQDYEGNYHDDEYDETDEPISEGQFV